MQEKENNNDDFLKHSKENAFKVPEGYFETFSDRLREKILDEKEKESKKKTFTLRPFINSKLAMAASFLLFVSISYFTVNIILNNNSGDYYTDLIDYEIADYDLGLLAEYYEEDEYSEQGEYFSEEETIIIDYLVTEDFDIDMIIEEF